MNNSYLHVYYSHTSSKINILYIIHPFHIVVSVVTVNKNAQKEK